jgi:hypothetical protein
MSTAARKARKRAGEKFVRPEKVGTPVEERGVDLAKQDALTARMQQELERFARNARVALKES